VKLFRPFTILLVIVLISAALPASAQEDSEPTLRELARRNGIYIGAAAWAYHLDDPVHAEILGREFNMLTPEHEAKHCMIESEQGVLNFDPVDRLVDFAEANDMLIHGHTLVWHSCMPDWITNGTFTRDEAIELLRGYITAVMERYKGRIRIWDVVNEAIDDSGSGLRDTPWRQLIGDDYVELAFQFAHEADPTAMLFYNDYGAEAMNVKSDAVYAMLADFKERGIPVDGVGLQSHFTVGTVNPESIAENIQRLGGLGLTVQITELDIRFDGAPTEEILQQQARDYRNVVNVCLESNYCTAVVIWGVSDKYSWLRGSDLGFFENPDVAPLLYDDEYQPKLAYIWVLDALARAAGEPAVLSDDELAEPEAAAIVLPEPAKSDPAQLSPDSVPGVAYYAPFSVTITLDGQTDDWANVPRVTIDSGPMIPANNDTTMTFAVAADETNLYFLADVTDSNIVYGNYDASSWYREDSIEFYLNTTGDLSASSYTPGIVQIGIMAANLANPDTLAVGGSNSADSKVSAIAVETENGYLIEASVPLVTDVWTITPEHLGVLGFQAHLNGSSGEDRDTKLIWSVFDIADQSYTNPSLFGQLIFWDVAQ
jgi:endo-1,4-beta-xylanase